MRPIKVIFLGAVATVFAVSQTSAWAEHHEGAQTISGRIMPLHEYFSMGNGTDASSKRSSDRYPTGDLSDPSRVQKEGNATQPTPGTTPSTPGVSSTPSTSPEKANDRPPGQYSSSSLNTNHDAGQSGWAGQPLVLIASASASPLVGGRTDSLTPQPQGNDPARPSSEAGLASSAQIVAGQAYLLVCDPQDHATMAAIAAVRDNRSPVMGKETPSSSTADLEQRRARDRADELSRDRDRDLSGNQDRSSRDATLNRNSTLASKGAYAEVKVTGKVLQRGGLQAIHVVSIQGADGSASKHAGSYKRNEGLNPTPKKEQ